MFYITAVYSNDTGSRFDSAYYLDCHSPRAESMLKAHGLQMIRTTFGVSGLDGSPPPFWAISEMHFASRGEFDAAMAACGEALFADIPNYTDVGPVLQISELAGSKANSGENDDARL